MRRVTGFVTKSLATGLLVGGTVLAQPLPPPPPAAPPTDAKLGPAPEAPPLKDPTTMTPQEMLMQAKQDGETTKNALAKIEQMQEVARKDNDIIKLNCLSDLGVQIKAAMNIGDQAMLDLQDAIARRDQAAQGHAFTKHSIVTQKVDLLAGEAGSCVGQDVAFVGETNVTVQIDPRMGRIPPPGAPLPRFTVDRPPEASPFI